MAASVNDDPDSLRAFWENLDKEAKSRGLKTKSAWYRKAKRLADDAGSHNFISLSNFNIWVKNERKGTNDWPWDLDLQFIVQAAVGADEKDWEWWERRWKDLREPGGGDKGATQEPPRETSNRGKWLTTVAAIVTLIAAVVGIYTNIFRGSNKSAGDTGGTHATTSPSASPDESLKCRGSDCLGKDPERLGCDRDAEVIFSDAPVVAPYQGIVIKVKRSEACQAVWAQMTGGTVGDMIEIFGGGSVQRDTVIQHDHKYTPMLPVLDGMRAKACVTRKGEERYCAKPVPVEASN